MSGRSRGSAPPGPARRRAPPEGAAWGPLEEARAWVEPRLAGAPRELAAEVRACLERVSGRVRPGWTVAETLAGAAVEAFDRVLAGGRQGREGAVLLLAADATLTYAFEAAAELGEDLAGLAERVGVRGLLGRRLEELASGGGPAEGRWG